MSRRKAPALVAPSTLEQAILLLERSALLQASLQQLDADRSEAVAKINAAHDQLAKPVEQELKSLFNQLKPWWAVAKDALLKKGTKSMALGGCMIGTRTATPSLRHEGKVEDAIQRLKDAGLDIYLRVKTSLDKAAILSAFSKSESESKKLTDAKFSTKQAEEFFIDRLPPKAAGTESIAAQDEVELVA